MGLHSLLKHGEINIMIEIKCLWISSTSVFGGVWMSCGSRDPCEEPPAEVAAQQPVSAGSRLSGFRVAWPDRRGEAVAQVTLMPASEPVLSFLLACSFARSFPNEAASGSLVSEEVCVGKGGPVPLTPATRVIQVTVENPIAKQIRSPISCLIVSWNWLTLL